jgi:hypothetical protein
VFLRDFYRLVAEQQTAGPWLINLTLFSPLKAWREYVAEKLSGLPETIGKEASCGDNPLPLR